MGMIMSFMGKGLPSSQMFNMLMSTLYKQFSEKEIDNFEDFHEAFLDIFNTVNSALPGKHYDVPSRKDVEERYNKWEGYPEAKRQSEFVEFMKKNMKLSSLDDITIKTGIVTPPAAMAIKKAGQNVPQMKMIKAIPDVIFVPSITLIALISAKLSRKIIQRKSSPQSPSPSTQQALPNMEAAAPTASQPPSPQPKTVVPEAQEYFPPSRVASKPAEEPQPRRRPPPPYQPSDPKEASKTTWYTPSFPKQERQLQPQDFHSHPPAAS
ncbi:hypothetical protein Dsin_008551 [Dipteronia sinensis]|uniref:Uncharacterized protein n=1 Tax=Dipteronia sinensis TaxID=43782 RepID=A0AAE0EAW5_9ROSI|nr:hypothetical protein Dsin_008551 [Dipteronia sinensis]